VLGSARFALPCAKNTIVVKLKCSALRSCRSRLAIGQLGSEFGAETFVEIEEILCDLAYGRVPGKEQSFPRSTESSWCFGLVVAAAGKVGEWWRDELPGAEETRK